jgi:hypothetical protein
MPAFLIHNPRCVFIHNPKTGGQALREILLQGPCEGPVTGPLPPEWEQNFVFAMVRNPFDRLVSAWKMFTQGTADTGWRVPRDLNPQISLAGFMEIVTDESIGYGTAAREGRIRIRNHTLPQSHAYYAIGQADFVGRFENYQDDVAEIFRRIGLAHDPPAPRHVTRRGPYRQYFDEVTRRQAEAFYAADLQQFGYRF